MADLKHQHALVYCGHAETKRVHDLMVDEYMTMLPTLSNLVCQYGIPTYKKFTLPVDLACDSHIYCVAMTTTHLFVSTCSNNPIVDKNVIYVFAIQDNGCFAFIRSFGHNLYEPRGGNRHHMCVVQNKLVVCDTKESKVLLFDITDTTAKSCDKPPHPTCIAYDAKHVPISVINVNDKLVLVLACEHFIDTMEVVSDATNFSKRQILHSQFFNGWKTHYSSFGNSILGWNSSQIKCLDLDNKQVTHDILTNTHVTCVASSVTNTDYLFYVTDEMKIVKFSFTRNAILNEWSIAHTQTKCSKIMTMICTPVYLICIDPYLVQWFPMTLFE